MCGATFNSFPSLYSIHEKMGKQEIQSNWLIQSFTVPWQQWLWIVIISFCRGDATCSSELNILRFPWQLRGFHSYSCRQEEAQWKLSDPKTKQWTNYHPIIQCLSCYHNNTTITNATKISSLTLSKPPIQKSFPQIVVL